MTRACVENQRPLHGAQLSNPPAHARRIDHRALLHPVQRPARVLIWLAAEPKASPEDRL